jgi:hypothetical protein
VDSPKSDFPYHPDLKVTLTGRPTKVRNTFRISGASPCQSFLAYNDTTLGRARALNERLFYIKEDGFHKEPNRPNAEYFQIEMKEFEHSFGKLSTFCHPLTVDDIVNMSHGRKRVRYEAARENLRVTGYLDKYAWLKFFMKFETYDFVEKKNPVPRGINPRHDEHLVEDGRYHKPLEKKLYRDLERFFGFEVVMKGYNQEKRGEIMSKHWGVFESPCAIAGDAKRFEQCMSKPALKFTYRVFSKYFPGDKHFRRLCNLKLVNKGMSIAKDGFIKFMVHGLRMSGDLDTASGNCLMTAALAWTYMKRIGITQYRIVLDGDDVIFIIDKRNLDKFLAEANEWYLSMGFRMEFEKTVYDLEHVDFCKSRPVWTPKGYVMVRNVKRALSKDALSKIAFSSEKHVKRWYAAVGAGGVSLTGGIPVCQSYYDMYARSAEGQKPLDIYDPWDLANKMKGMKRVRQDIAMRTRYSFWLAFGITPDEQQAIERVFDSTHLDSRIKTTFKPVLLPM